MIILPGLTVAVFALHGQICHDATADTMENTSHLLYHLFESINHKNVYVCFPSSIYLYDLNFDDSYLGSTNKLNVVHPQKYLQITMLHTCNESDTMCSIVIPSLKRRSQNAVKDCDDGLCFELLNKLQMIHYSTNDY